MPQFRTKRRVRHAAGEMFDLVADIERYPECRAALPVDACPQRTEGGEGIVTVVADMTVAYKLIRETFTSRVTLDRPNTAESWSNISTARFSRMENRWDFHPAGEQLCDVEFLHLL